MTFPKIDFIEKGKSLFSHLTQSAISNQYIEYKEGILYISLQIRWLLKNKLTSFPYIYKGYESYSFNELVR